eukprot:5706736-Pleurochrysis_carterae.AAC.1
MRFNFLFKSAIVRGDAFRLHRIRTRAGEKKLSEVFDACADLLEESPAVLLFLDEIDALAGSRENASMHEATRRTLSGASVEGEEG